MYWVYMLLCENGALYTGQTSSLPRRCVEHRQGKGARYTRANPPVRLVYYEAAPDRSSALKREYQVRSLRRAQKDRLIADLGEPPSLRRINRLVYCPETSRNSP